MHQKSTVEIVYYHIMRQWQETAPEDGKKGLLNGNPTRNSQMSRLAYILSFIACGLEDQIYQILSRYTPRNDGHSYISRNPNWMNRPVELSGGWYFEGCTSLRQKQDIIQCLTKLGLSPAFVACVNDFVANKNIERYYPSLEEMKSILKREKIAQT